MESTDSQELSEWMAYELVNGEIGQSRTEHILADIHEVLQQVCRILIAANSDEDAEIPEINPYPRPREMMDWGDEDG